MAPVTPVERLRAICLALPEAVEQPRHRHTAPCFRVLGKMFLGIEDDLRSMYCKAPSGAQEALVGSDPLRFFVPPEIGAWGWVAARLDVEQNWGELTELVHESYRMCVPKRMWGGIRSNT